MVSPINQCTKRRTYQAPNAGALAEWLGRPPRYRKAFDFHFLVETNQKFKNFVAFLFDNVSAIKG